MVQLEHIEAIEKRLWNAADTLRANSNYASNEYFLPVMGLIFLRHAYSRFLAVKDDIEAGLPKRGGKTRALAKEDFSQKSAIYLQPKAQFDYLVSLPDSEDRAKAIIWLYRGRTDRFLGLVRDYCSRMLTEAYACFTGTDDDLPAPKLRQAGGNETEPLPAFSVLVSSLHEALQPFLDTLTEDGPHVEAVKLAEKIKKNFEELGV